MAMSDEISEVGEFGFVEFVNELVSGVFETVTKSSMDQARFFVDYASMIEDGLAKFIKNTKSDITPDQCMDFLKLTLGPSVDYRSTVKAADVNTINASTAMPAGTVEAAATPAANQLTSANTINQPADVQLPAKPTDDATRAAFMASPIIQAVANRLAASQYEDLQNLLKMGLSRIVVEKGSITSRLNFRAQKRSQKSAVQGTSSSTTNSSGSSSGGAIGGGLFGGVLGIGGGYRSSGSDRTIDIKCSTDRATKSSSLEENVAISGQVSIQFKSDYLPLDTFKRN